MIRGILNIPDLQGLMVGIWASFGLDFATFFSILLHLKPFGGYICLFPAFCSSCVGLTIWFDTPLIVITRD